MNAPLPVFLTHWNAPDWIASSVLSILASDVPVAITIIDNGPPEATSKLAFPAEVEVLQSGGNLGYAGGANVGLRQWLEGSEDYCIVGAHDLHVEPQTLRLLVQAADAHQDFGILGPAVDDGGKGALLDQTERIEERTWVSGTCLLLRRRCIEEIGLFDELLHSYAEDEEMGMRAALHGFKVGRVLEARAHGLGSGNSHSQRSWLGNRIVLTARYQGLASVIPLVARYICHAAISVAAMFLLRGDRRAGHRRTVNRYLGATCLGLGKLLRGGWSEPRY